MSLHNCFVEVARAERAKDARESFTRAQKALRALTNATMAGHRVTGGDLPYGADHCHVPGFGHDAKHADGLKKSRPEPAGVDRFFGASIATDGHPPLAEICGSWKIAPGVHLIVCAATVPQEGARHPIPRADERDALAGAAG